MNPPIKRIYIFGGGTLAHVTSHFAVCAPAYGTTAEQLYCLARDRFGDVVDVELELTKMAGGSLETNEDVERRIDQLKADPSTKIIFFSVAMCDWAPTQLTTRINVAGKDTYCPHTVSLSKHASRLETRGVDEVTIRLEPALKIISSIRTGRKDIFLVGFKTTCGATKQQMYEKGLRLCKEGSVNLVLVNDVKTRWNMIVTPEEAAYHETSDRAEVLKQLVDMAWYRSQLTFTQSMVVDGKPVAWSDSRVPHSLRTVVDHCIKGRAYKTFNGGTVGHFAVRLSETEFLTSIRKSDFNRLTEVGLVYVKTDGPDTVLAYGAKPSVGGQSQRIVFNDHPGFDCIAHFHCPLRPNHPDDIPVKSQREVECGSHACGRQTSNGLRQFGNLKAVYLDQHGPNIVFPSTIDPQEVIDFIERNFDLSQKTGGYNLPAKV
jgi:hypothetical protein